LVRIATASEGNPFFALETARTLRDQGASSAALPLPLPSSLRELVAIHVRGLSASAREAVTITAALSRPTFPAMASALGSEAIALAALTEAEGAGILILEGDRIRFAHPLFAWGIYGSLSAPRRRLLHRRLANLTSDLEERARHIALSDPEPHEETAQQMEAAARQAVLRGAPEAGVEIYNAACRLTPPDRPIELARRLLGQSSASLVTGNVDGARATASRVVEAAPVASIRAEGLVLLSDAAWVEGLPRVAADHLEAALALAAADPDIAPQILAKLVEVFAVLDPVRALAHSRTAMQQLDQEREPRLLAHALFNHVYAEAVLGRPPDLDLFNRGLALEMRAGPEVRPSTIPLMWYVWTDNFEAARARHAMEHGWYREHGNEAWVAERLGVISQAELRAGHWDLAEQYIEQSFTTLQQFELEGSRAGPWMSARHIRALIDASRGRTKRARAMLQPSIEETSKREQWFWAAIALSWLAFVEFADKRHEAVDRALTAARDHIESMGAAEVVGSRTEPIHVESLVALGRLARAREVLARLEARGRTFPRLWITVTLPRARALVAAGEGDLAGAIRGMADSDSNAARLLPFEHGLNLLVYGRLLRRAKQRGAAAEALTEAVAVFEQLGAPSWLAQARSELDRVGMRRAPQELTATERRIAELAAGGMTNKQVAAALFISPKTVETNLARAYSKLGIKSRAELGARVKEFKAFSQT
jgi:DNA-binding CsgD family transcriptional regulator